MVKSSSSYSPMYIFWNTYISGKERKVRLNKERWKNNGKKIFKQYLLITDIKTEIKAVE